MKASAASPATGAITGAPSPSAQPPEWGTPLPPSVRWNKWTRTSPNPTCTTRRSTTPNERHNGISGVGALPRYVAPRTFRGPVRFGGKDDDRSAGGGAGSRVPEPPPAPGLGWGGGTPSRISGADTARWSCAGAVAVVVAVVVPRATAGTGVGVDTHGGVGDGAGVSAAWCANGSTGSTTRGRAGACAAGSTAAPASPCTPWTSSSPVGGGRGDGAATSRGGSACGAGTMGSGTRAASTTATATGNTAVATVTVAGAATDANRRRRISDSSPPSWPSEAWAESPAAQPSADETSLAALGSGVVAGGHRTGGSSRGDAGVAAANRCASAAWASHRATRAAGTTPSSRWYASQSCGYTGRRCDAAPDAGACSRTTVGVASCSSEVPVPPLNDSRWATVPGAGATGAKSSMNATRVCAVAGEFR